ncbi:MAG: ABC transporter ATP-binding protein [Burkholderiales bacterium]|nr:ABC transporter ATP-binding protein [Burkholderiales bacterium]
MPDLAGAGLRVALRQPGPIPLNAEFTCGRGELLVLVGPSGSGKTTLLRSIAGLYRPRKGAITCNGATWFDTRQKIDLAPQRRSIGFVFQSYGLFPHLSALENVKTTLGHVAGARRDGRARELLALVHLEGLEARRPAELSGGQQQRTALARALARDPTVLLLDEPFSAVDQVTRKKLQRELAQLRRQLDMPIVLVTHDLNEARMLADRICILHQGDTLQTGSPEEVMARPVSPLVARLVDLPNVFEGKIVEHRPYAQLTLISWVGYALEVRYQPEFLPGASVNWVIPAEYVLVHRRDRPSRGERENPVAGIIAEYVPLGEHTSVTFWVRGEQDHAISMMVPTHVARRNGLGQGEHIKVSLLAEGIHLMPGVGKSDPLAANWGVELLTAARM